MQGVDRVRRVAELVRRELSQFIIRELTDYGVGIVSITAVDMTRDLRKATVYVTAFDGSHDKEKVISILNESVSVMRKTLASQLELRRVPELEFHYDFSVERGMRLSKMIDQLAAGGDTGDEP
ncbi:MAG: 30S ribosome-binding factor RbfA [Pseudomonadota bacterium]|nr:30S ribosome-binding factor RbfA [Pseudomonadota bacterium]MEE3288626.1 30S ribosome-binding factor RbfA [Pseudomonadota bacterium]